MKVAVYTVMRDERDNIAQWAETTGDADYRYVLDTGSTDDTLEQLETHGIEFDSATFEPFRFDDARNTALAMLPADIDYCLQLDADETLSWDWRMRFESVCDFRVRRYRYVWEDAPGARAGVVMRTNLHARHGFRWKYPCHEVLTPDNVAIADVPLMRVTHRPNFMKSRDHYFGMLRDGVIENPSDHRMAFYYGRELWYRGLWDGARQQLMVFLGLPGGWNAERCEAWRIIAAIDDDPERWLWKAIGECPARREPWVDLARFYLRQEDADSASAMLEMARLRTDESLYTTTRDCWGDEFEMLCAALDVP